MLVDNIASFHVYTHFNSDILNLDLPESFISVRCLLASPTRLPDLGWKDSLVVWSSRQARYSWDKVVSLGSVGIRLSRISNVTYIGILKYE